MEAAATSFLGLATGTVGILLLWAGIAALGFLYGTARIKAAALSLLITGFLVSVLPQSVHTLAQGIVPPGWVLPLLFMCIAGGAYMTVARAIDVYDADAGIIEVAATTTALMMLLALFSYTVFSAETLAPYYPPAVEGFFSNPEHAFWIGALALLLLFFV